MVALKPSFGLLHWENVLQYLGFITVIVMWQEHKVWKK